MIVRPAGRVSVTTRAGGSEDPVGDIQGPFQQGSRHPPEPSGVGRLMGLVHHQVGGPVNRDVRCRRVVVRIRVGRIRPRSRVLDWITPLPVAAGTATHRDRWSRPPAVRLGGCRSTSGWRTCRTSRCRRRRRRSTAPRSCPERLPARRIGPGVGNRQVVGGDPPAMIGLAAGF